MTTAHVGVAGNIEPERHVAAAIESLRSKFDLTGEAPVYRTAPIGRPDQDAYWNTVVSIQVSMDPAALHETLRAMERAAGRVRTEDRYAARTLDLDILLWDGEPLNDAARDDIQQRPWNQWCLHRLHAWPEPDTPEPTPA